MSSACLVHRPVRSADADDEIVYQRPQGEPDESFEPLETTPLLQERKPALPRPVLRGGPDTLFEQTPPRLVPSETLGYASRPKPASLPVSRVIPLEEAFPEPAMVLGAHRAQGRLDSLGNHAVLVENARPLQMRDKVPPKTSAPVEVVRVKSRPSYHRVAKGETLWAIAKRYGSTPAEFRSFNPHLTQLNSISVDQQLVVPRAGAAPPRQLSSVRPRQSATLPVVETAKPFTSGRGRRNEIHVLQPGETLWSVARKYKTTVTNLLLLNSLREASSLRAGLELYVPAQVTDTSPKSRPVVVASKPSRPVEVSADTHIVCKGDSLWNLSRKYGVSVDQLLKWNDLADLSVLPIGTALRVRGTSPPRIPVSSKPTNPSSVNQPSFDWPVRGEVVRTFGWYEGRPHTGIDIKARLGAAVVAVAAGKVIFSGPMPGYGKVIIIDHENEYFSVYGNNRENRVFKGTASRVTRVARGETIASVGADVEGPYPHLHFEIRKKNKAINPLRFLPY